MPITPTYPGVYIEEIPSGVRTITGVATSITAFIGSALKGPVNQPTTVQSFGEFERLFGGLWVTSAMSYAVQQYFLNGGSEALIIRVVGEKASSAIGGGDGFSLRAASPGAWANGLKINLDRNTSDRTNAKLFNLQVIQQITPDNAITLEVFRNLSTDTNSPRFATKVLQQQSAIVNLTALPADAPSDNKSYSLSGGADGDAPTYSSAYKGNENDKTGLYALENADLFNLLCIPPRARGTTVAGDSAGSQLLADALAYCKKRRALLIVDPPSSWSKPADVRGNSGVDSLGLRDENAAVYYPEVLLSDPLQENRLESFPPCGVVAGIMARTDAQRGVWKAPAGIEATLLGVKQLAYKLTDGENGQLNPLGVNCLRSFPVYGNIVWGARTLEGDDRLASEWKYIPVRRIALFLEESLYRGTQWVVFEPNDEPLWAQIRLNIGAFMNNLFRQGAFQGKTPREAYFVKCDKETTTQNDIDRGIVNIVVGFAPLKPAEFVIIKFQQIAGQITT
ncbi:MAG: phage tail sheath C-terminal domain-containing protein [Synechococcales bacterium]|nr:phage tail sheath C-terminal domain-containing protein [Synechococcales bacterium]